jgi:hypothetical protein
MKAEKKFDFFAPNHGTENFHLAFATRTNEGIFSPNFHN